MTVELATDCRVIDVTFSLDTSQYASGDVLADTQSMTAALRVPIQALYMTIQYLNERAVSGTTVTGKKADGSTALYTLTLSDASDPTSITRAT